MSILTALNTGLIGLLAGLGLGTALAWRLLHARYQGVITETAQARAHADAAARATIAGLEVQRDTLLEKLSALSDQVSAVERAPPRETGGTCPSISSQRVRVLVDASSRPRRARHRHMINSR